MGDSIHNYTEARLQDTIAAYGVANSHIENLKRSTSQIVLSASNFRSKVEVSGKSLDDISEMLAVEFGKLAQDIMKAFPLPELAEHHNETSKVASQVLGKVGEAFILACGAVGIPEEEATAFFQAIEPHVHQIIVIAGQYHFSLSFIVYF